MKPWIIGSDHGGYALKEHIKSLLLTKGMAVEDVGCHSADSCDYPDFAHLAAEGVASGKYSGGVLICTTGIGMSITANRYKKIRAALCYNEEAARLTRAHNDANLLVLGSRFVTFDAGEKILFAFLETPFDGGRHERRVEKIDRPV